VGRKIRFIQSIFPLFFLFSFFFSQNNLIQRQLASKDAADFFSIQSMGGIFTSIVVDKVYTT